MNAEKIIQIIQDALKAYEDEIGIVSPKMYCPNKMQNKVSVKTVNKVQDGYTPRFMITVDDTWMNSAGLRPEIKNIMVSNEDISKID